MKYISHTSIPIRIDFNDQFKKWYGEEQKISIWMANTTEKQLTREKKICMSERFPSRNLWFDGFDIKSDLFSTIRKTKPVWLIRCEHIIFNLSVLFRTFIFATECAVSPICICVRILISFSSQSRIAFFLRIISSGRPSYTSWILTWNYV